MHIIGESPTIEEVDLSHAFSPLGFGLLQSLFILFAETLLFEQVALAKQRVDEYIYSQLIQQAGTPQST